MKYPTHSIRKILLGIACWLISTINVAAQTDGWKSDGDALYLDAALGFSKIGVGTRSPTAKLEIFPSNSLDYPLLRIRDNRGRPVEPQQTVSTIFEIDQLRDALPGSQAAASLFSVSTTGWVGIGTDEPRNQLHVVGSIGSYMGNSWIQLNPRPLKMGLTWTSRAVGDQSRRRFSLSYQDTTGQGGNKEVLTAFPDGRVGVGTDSPTHLLTVAGSSAFSDAVDMGGDLRIATGKEIFFDDNGQIRSYDNNHRILFRREENKMELREFGDIVLSPGATNGNETATFVAKNDARIGIGTVSPEARLHVSKSSAIIGEESKGGGELIWVKRINLSSADESASDISADQTSVYVAGSDSSTRRWVIESRNKTDGTLLWRQDSPNSDGQPFAIELFGDFVYTAGDQIGGRWRIEKRRKANGSLVKKFGTNGSIDVNTPRIVQDIAVDNLGIYASGSSRLEKRNSENGELLWIVNLQDFIATGLAIDDGSMYLAGGTPGLSSQWRVEKRSKSDGALIWSQTVDRSPRGDLAQGTAVGQDGAYFFGRHDDRWRIEKRSLSNGNIIWEKEGDVGPIQAVSRVKGIDLDDDFIYLSGATRENSWRIEKRSRDTGDLVPSGFGSGGRIDINIKGLHERAQSIVRSDTSIYITGFDSEPGNRQWRTERRSVEKRFIGLVVTEQGHVGVGTKSPLESLHVAGKLQVDDVPSGGIDPICLNNSIVSRCASSRRYKEEISPLQIGLDAVTKLRPVEFSWRDSGREDIGLIAEEVVKVNPLLASIHNGRVEGVRYQQISAVLINAIIEQQTTIEEQMERIQTLELEMNSLRLMMVKHLGDLLVENQTEE